MTATRLNSPALRNRTSKYFSPYFGFINHKFYAVIAAKRYPNTLRLIDKKLRKKFNKNINYVTQLIKVQLQHKNNIKMNNL